MSARRPPAADRLDALLWFAIPALLLLVVPIGFVSNDGLGHSRSFASGTWRLNPNHLFFEPLGAWWQGFWAGEGSGREPVDVLKWLSALSGALAAALFRRGVASRLAATRWEANHATAWLALSSAFLRLCVSDEFHMIQMPFVVAAAWAALVYFERPVAGRALVLGAAVGLAALAFISNLGLGLAFAAVLAVWHLARREPRQAIGGVVAVGLGASLTSLPALLAAWLLSPGAPGFLAWLTRYGGVQAPRVAEVYGLARSWRGVGESAARALYGAASALVDLTPIAAAVRDRQAPSWSALAGALAFLAAAAVLLRGLALAWKERSQPAGRGAFFLALAFATAILGFGLFWNNSDDQFYFQLAPAFGALAAFATRTTARGQIRVAAFVLAVSLAALSWNVADVTARRVLYPRQERRALLEREVRGACLVVYPGFDEPELLLAMSRPAQPVERLALTTLAVSLPAPEGLRLLASRIDGCLSAHGKVVLIDIFDTPPESNPWKFLLRLGYDHDWIERALSSFPVEPASREVGPFTVRITRSAAPPRDRPSRPATPAASRPTA